MPLKVAMQPVVITGIGMVTPIGSCADEVVAAVRAGRSGIKEINVEGLLPVLMGKVEPDDADAWDRAADFARRSALDAIKMASLPEDFDPQRVVTVIGSSKGRVGNLLGPPGNCGDLSLDGFEHFAGDTLGLEVVRALGLGGGPVLNCPAACATGIVCLIRGIQALQSGEADVVLAGSAESPARALLLAAFSNMGALSGGVMRPFHVERNGFNAGEGGAVFVLEREDDALARGAQVLARVAGWDYRSDAAHMTGVEPDGSTLIYAIRRTLERAGWEPEAVDYINVHGTATVLNDLVESRAIGEVFGRQTPLVSSIKPYIGHLLGASSAVELAIALVCGRAGIAPPALHLDQVDPSIHLQFVRSNASEGCFQRILKLSLGFGGHIGVMALDLS